MSQKAVRVHWEGLAREEAGPGWTRAGFGAEKAQVMCNWYEPGAGSMEPDVHDFDQFTFVVEGSLFMVLDGVETIVDAGEMLYIPAGVAHGGVARGEGRTVNLDVFAPPREDYLYLHAWQQEQPDSTPGAEPAPASAEARSEADVRRRSPRAARCSGMSCRSCVPTALWGS